MAVRLDADAVREAVGVEAYRAAEELLAATGSGAVLEVNGGAVRRVGTAGRPAREAAGHEAWVGVVSGALVGECDCAVALADPAELCVHAVAATLAAVRDGFAWSSTATAPSAVEAELAAARRAIDALAAEAAGGPGDPDDVVQAGQSIVDEVESLTRLSPSAAVLRVAEHAARVWDGLVAAAPDLGDVDEEDVEDIRDAIGAVHRWLSGELSDGRSSTVVDGIASTSIT